LATDRASASFSTAETEAQKSGLRADSSSDSIHCTAGPIAIAESTSTAATTFSMRPM
jgi:hypothetical protein